jgi:hypothetical protein
MTAPLRPAHLLDLQQRTARWWQSRDHDGRSCESGCIN